MEKEICINCGGSKKFMTEGKTPKGSKLIYQDCNLCDEDGMIEIDENFIENTELDY